MSILLPGFRLGVVGGGQLGRMLAVEARRLGVWTVMLDPSPNAPAKGIADEMLCGDLYDPKALKALAEHSDVITYEIEHTNVDALAEIEAGGAIIHPRPAVLKIIQDKFRQKTFLREHGIPVPNFKAVAAADVATYVPEHFPVVQKLRTGGYDGRGVAVLSSPDDTRLQGESMFEDHVDVLLELSVIVARGFDASTAVYPVIEMVFDPRAQICSSVAAPARVSSTIAKKAINISLSAVQALQGVGVFAVELFLTKDKRLLVNEIAPRTHNSGHWTIEGAVTSQFEQQIRAVCSLPLGDTSLLRPSVMINLLGAPDAYGSPVLANVIEGLSIPGLRLHWYQKNEVKPFRKMGHATITAPDLATALAYAEKASTLLEVRGSRKEPQ